MVKIESIKPVIDEYHLKHIILDLIEAQVWSVSEKYAFVVKSKGEEEEVRLTADVSIKINISEDDKAKILALLLKEKE